MKIANSISTAVITAATTLMQPYMSELNPKNFIAALKAYGTEGTAETPRFSQPMTIKEVAALLRVSAPTINRMMNDGRLRRIKLTRSGAARIDPQSVKAMLQTPAEKEA